VILRAVVFLGNWLAFLVIFRSQPLYDPGALWHVRVGEWIFAHGFPHHDPFSWSYADHSWIPQQWAGECAMALLHRFGGYDTLLLALTTMMAGLATWLTERFVRTGLHPILAIGFVSFGMVVAGFHFYLRPHMVTMVLMALVMAWIVDFERKRIGIRRWIWFIPLCAVWTNIHGGVLGGIFTVGLALTGWVTLYIWRRLLARDTDDLPTGMGWLALIVALSAASTLVNPFGLEMHRTWWSIVGSKVLPRMIDEHMPLNPAQTQGQAVLGFGIFYLLMLAGTLPNQLRVSWYIPVIWLALSIQSIRHGPLFCITALVALADLFPETIWYRLIKKYGDTFIREPNPAPPARASWVIPVLAVALALGLQMARVKVPIIGTGWARFDPKMVPIEMIEPIQEYARSKPDGFPIFNDANFGGFLMYYAPNLRVFMDDRCELYGDEGLLKYSELMNDHPERIELLTQKTPFDRALVANGSDMDRYLKGAKQWREVARCQRAVLYERLGEGTSVP
jgi:hypothetical protein